MAVLTVAIGAVLTVFANVLFSLSFAMESERRVQVRAYSAGVAVILAGTLGDVTTGFTSPGLAAAILTVADSLVLFRMAGSFDKRRRSGFVANLALLVVILLLYYAFMAVMIFPPG